jgi:hypothetical protein
MVKGLQPGCQLFNEGVMRGGGMLFGSFADAIDSPGGGAFSGDAQAEGGSVFSSECPAVIAGSMLGIRRWVTYEKRLSTSADMMLISSEVLA